VADVEISVLHKVFPPGDTLKGNAAAIMAGGITSEIE
jgi:hypothetical protein